MDELIKKSKEGDVDAFTQLIHSINNDLYRVAKSMLDCNDDISDAIQETMIIAYKKIKRLSDNSKFKSWIIKILINECNNIYRKRKKHSNICKIVKENSNLVIYDFENFDINSKIDFNLLIEHLNYEEKLIITLYYNSSYSCDEISKILNMNVNTVKSKLIRARNKLKKLYKGGIFYE